ncbi:autophagy protein 12-like [Frankliniella occidentalis]|uniref:Ubiquitin-like protein ATG12 n=1 Tax=Frankliniella occidentalis TaxID=133901 RepID=A0A6J1TPT5_FRAOC|nr:autophagy protein 12-like [Frankliniella occidentalis]
MADSADSPVETPESDKTLETQSDREIDSVPSEPPSTSGVADSPSKAKTNKIDILLKATGNAPIMKTKKWALDKDKKIGWIIDFIKKYLKLEPSESLFLYVNQAFAPAPDQIVRNIYDCYGSDGKLVLHYCKSQAWG